MLNKIKVKNFEVWDAETGEADILAKFQNNIELKAFTLDQFENNEDTDVIVSLFCHDFEIFDKPIESKISNIEDDFHAEVIGKIVDFISNQEEGNIITIDCNNIFLLVYIDSEDIEKIKKGYYFKGSGRLDIETQIES
ncbi:MAG: hypothetical protein U0354_01745 [Candidatus Sericytochromatia bacterium]